MMTSRSSKSSRTIAYCVKNNCFLSDFNFIAILSQTVKTEACKFPFLLVSLHAFVMLLLTYLPSKAECYDLSNISSYGSYSGCLLWVFEGFCYFSLNTLEFCIATFKTRWAVQRSSSGCIITYIKARYFLCIICTSSSSYPVKPTQVLEVFCILSKTKRTEEREKNCLW